MGGLMRLRRRWLLFPGREKTSIGSVSSTSKRGGGQSSSIPGFDGPCRFTRQLGMAAMPFGRGRDAR